MLRDKHTDTTYIFKSDAKDVSARISQKDAVLSADEWAAGFYGDALLQFVECQFKTNPIRHWLVTFQKTETGQQYHAVILPDGRVVMPSVERGLQSFFKSQHQRSLDHQIESERANQSRRNEHAAHRNTTSLRAGYRTDNGERAC